jgi:hypothetical protein
MPNPQDPQTLDETETMDGTVTSFAVDSIGKPTVIVWIRDDATGDTHQMNAGLDTDAVASLGMLHVLREASAQSRRVRLRWTDDGGVKWFHLARVL